MNFTKKFDRAFQWAGEKMGQEARTGTTEEFRNLELEMALRFDGMTKLQTTMNAYIKWLTHRDTLVGEKGVPTAVMARTMIAHGEDFDRESQFGNCLIEMGRANEQVSNIQEQYANDATRYWADSLERSVAMMKEYQAARKKLESRRLALDASTTKMQKAKRDDFRLEEELRSAKAKYEETNEDVFRRMQDIKDAEADSVRDLTRFLDVELDYHERCAEALRQKRAQWSAGAAASSPTDYARRPSGRSRSNTAQSGSFHRTPSYGQQGQSLSPYRSNAYAAEPDEYDEMAMPPQQPPRQPIRSQSRISVNSAASDSLAPPPPPPSSSRPGVARASTFAGGPGAAGERTLGVSLSRTPSNNNTTQAISPGGLSVLPPPQVNGGNNNIGSLRGQLRSTGANRASAMDVFADDDSGASSDTPPGSASPATSYGSSSRTNISGGAAPMGAVAGKKAPPPPPSRAKKPPPPVPNRREREV